MPLTDADVAATASARALLTVDLPVVTVNVIGALPALELVVASSVVVDHIDLDACSRLAAGVWFMFMPSFSLNQTGFRLRTPASLIQ